MQDSAEEPIGSEPSPGQVDVVAPLQAPAFLALTARAARDGVDVEALRGLLWLLNAHPRLLGHRQCLRNLQQMIGMQSLMDGVAQWAGGWHRQIQRWHGVIRWATSLEPAQRDALEPFFAEPSHARHHVVMRHGVTRHPMASALWTRHHGDREPAGTDPAPGTSSRAFRLLQWHLFCAHAEFRARSSSVEQYEHYGGAHEWPAEPMPTDDVGRAVRELSHAEYDGFLEALPVQHSTVEFAFELTCPYDDLLDLAESYDAGARALALLRWFGTFLELIGGSEMGRRARAIGHGRRTGSRHTIPGFVHFVAVPNVFVELAAADSGDDDVPVRDFAQIHVSADALTPSAMAELESQGLAPQEDLLPVLHLFPPGDRPGGINSLYIQRRAIEAAAQRFAWDRRNLTPFEVRALVQVLDESAPCRTGETATSVRAQASLLLRSALLLGSDLLHVIDIGLLSKQRLAEKTESSSTNVFGRWVVYDERGECVGIAVSTVQPAYRRPESGAFASCAQRSSPFLLLPDAAGIGARLLALAGQRGAIAEGPVFVCDRAELICEANSLLARANARLDPDSRGRVTLVKVRDKLASLLAQAGVEEVAAALIVGDRSYAGQARLHYTQHAVSTLQQAYSKAAKRLLRDAGGPPFPASSFPAAVSLPKGGTDTCNGVAGAVVGARLVVTTASLRALVKHLRELLEATPVRTRSAWHAYHDAFLLYSVLIQHMTTGVRLDSNPHRFMAAVLGTEAAGAMADSKTRSIVQSVADKDNQYLARSRAVHIPARLHAQLQLLAEHARHVRRWKPIDVAMPGDDDVKGAFMAWADDPGLRSASVIQPAWIASQLARHGLPAPANFHRAYLRTRLVANKCPQQSIDALLGHANAGEIAHIRHGTFDYDGHLATIDRHIASICDEVGLVPVYSRLLHPARRSGTDG